MAMRSPLLPPRSGLLAILLSLLVLEAGAAPSAPAKPAAPAAPAKPAAPAATKPAAAPAKLPGLPGLLPAESAKKAALLLEAIDAANKGIEARLDAARKAGGAAELAALEAAAVLEASQGGLSAISPDASYSGAEAAAAALAAARTKAFAAALAVAEGKAMAEGKSVAELSALRAAKAKELAALVAAAGLGEKAALAAEPELLRRSKGLPELFPEGAAAGKALMKAGAAGRKIWLSALSACDAEAAAEALVAARPEAAKAAPAASSALDGLEAALRAFRAWRTAAPFALHPSAFMEGGQEGAPGTAPLNAAYQALGALGEERAVALLKAFEASPYRVSEASAAQRLSLALEAMTVERRRGAALGLGLSPADCLGLALLCGRAAAPAAKEPPAAQKPATAGTAPLAPAAAAGKAAGQVTSAHEAAALEASVRELNRLKAELAAAEGAPDRGGRERTIALALLARRDLLALAAQDERYAALFSAAGKSLGPVFREAEKGALERAARDPAAAKRLARLKALHKAEPRLSLAEGKPEAGVRRFSLLARFPAAEGAEAVAAMDPALAGPAYALAFAEAAGLASELKSLGPAAFLERYGVRFVPAYPGARDLVALPASAFPPPPKGADAALAAARLAAAFEAGLCAEATR